MMHFQGVFNWAVAMAVVMLTSMAVGSERVNSTSGFLDFNLYPVLTSVDTDSVATINIGAKMTSGFSYFSLTNFYNQDNKNELSNTVAYYTEQNLRWTIGDSSPFDLTAQLNFRTGDNNDRYRLGVRWRFNNTQGLQSLFETIHLAYSINLHAIQFDHNDGDVWQMEHVFFMRFPYLSERLYLSGFIDHTFNEKLPDSIPDDPIVAEAQLGYRLIENLYVVAEYRLNQYRRSDVNNIAAGVQYKIRW